MPIIPLNPVGRATSALNSWVRQFDALLNSAPAASLLVASTAVLLWVFRIELQYVVGAWLIYAAQRLAQKRLSPTALQIPPERKPEPPRQRPLREAVDNPLGVGPLD